MKRQDDFGVGGALFLSVIFAIMAILSYNSDKSGNPIAIIPAIGVVGYYQAERCSSNQLPVCQQTSRCRMRG